MIIVYEKDFGNYWSIPAEKLMQNLQTDISGLSSGEANKRLKVYGENTIKKQKKSNENNAFSKPVKKSDNAYFNFCHYSIGSYRRFN